MPRLLDPIEVGKEMLHGLWDTPDPSLNYIEALTRLITVAEEARSYPDGTSGTVRRSLEPFEDKYELARQGETNGN